MMAGERDDGRQHLPASAGSDRRLVEAIDDRFDREERARDRLRGVGSRWARGCSAIIAGAATLAFGAATLVMIFLVPKAGPSILLGASMFAGMATGFGWLTWRWARGFNPGIRIREPTPTEIKELASKMQHDGPARSP